MNVMSIRDLLSLRILLVIVIGGMFAGCARPQRKKN